jgi:hypothetical protein
MDNLREVFEDFTIINSAKRLRGCLLHACRIMKRSGYFKTAINWERRIKNMPEIMDKEAINVVLMSACFELKKEGLI